MATHMIIEEYKTGKLHSHKLNVKAAFKSISYEVEYVGDRRTLVIRDYYSGNKLQQINVAKYGSVQFWAE